ncbi:hypothetical protein [Nocardioides sp.]|uniref:hypothetical protein n=1 Tax=Nocardioides sp. TaxID=35761 RepID=UPI00286DBC1D|nr:hypothetical protein [Nocardioides sp.]
MGRRPTVVPSTVTPAATGPQSVPPSRFEAVAETLASGEDPHGVCSVVGRMLGADGASLEDALGGLRATWLEVRGSDPSFDATSALLAAWSDETLAYVHQLSCADPMTGLSSLVHVRSRLTELYLRSDRVHEDWAMVVCELPLPPVPAADGSDGAYRLVHSMRLARAGQCVRTVFVLGETVGRVGSRRVAALVERDGRLGDRVRLLRRLLEDVVDHTPTARVWIEGLPVDDVNAALLLDDLAR